MVSTSEEEGVIGYQVTTVQPANMAPSAQAALPSMMILPAVSYTRSTWKRSGSVNVLVANSNPAWQAPQFSSAALAFFLPNCLTSDLWISSISMESSFGTTPSEIMLVTSFRNLASGQTGATSLSNGTGKKCTSLRSS